MNFTQLKTKITTLLDRSDYDTRAGEFINSAIHILEQTYDWRQMEAAPVTGNLTTSIDYIDIPARYKNVKCLFITVDTREKPLSKKSYFWIKSHYPSGSNSKGEPEMFATKTGESKFVIRPYPQQTYAYELVYNAFSSDLVTDTNESNFWMSDMWEIVYYGALINYELDSGKKLDLGTADAPLSPRILYDSLLGKLMKTQTDEELSHYPLYSGADYVY